MRLPWVKINNGNKKNRGQPNGCFLMIGFYEKLIFFAVSKLLFYKTNGQWIAVVFSLAGFNSCDNDEDQSEKSQSDSKQDTDEN